MKTRNSQISFLALILILPIIGISQNPLLIPDTLKGASFILNLQTGSHPFFVGPTTNTMGVNGNILGPTLILDKGQAADMYVQNSLSDTTTIHWHGLHVSPENDGGPHITIAPGNTWNPQFTVLDDAGTYWYHPHLHEHTNEHVSKGIAGFIIVRDSIESNLALPRRYGLDDFPLVIQTKDFDNSNQIVVPSNSDDVLMVNATLDPVLSVPSQVVRFRILNGSSMRVFNLGLSNNMSFHQIASDGGLLSSPIQLTRLRLSPGERAEILIDFTTLFGQSVQLISYASEFQNGIYGATNPGMSPVMSLNGYSPNPLNGQDFNIIDFIVDTTLSNPITSIPSSLVSITPIPEAQSNITRNLTFTPMTMGMNQLNGNFLINGVSFDMNTFNYTIPLNNTEIWSITNQSATAHPFHIHDVQFYILDRNGNSPGPSESGKKDVVLIHPMETVRFITKFTNHSNDSIPYMYHCHMLIHEDGGMMGSFRVVDQSTGIGEDNDDSKTLLLYPNPTTGTFWIEQKNGDELGLVQIIDAQGKIIDQFNSAKNKELIDLNRYLNGLYFLRNFSGFSQVSYKILYDGNQQ